MISGDACEVGQDVQPTEVLDHAPHQGSNIVHPGQIHRTSKRPPPCRFDLPHRLQGGLFVEDGNRELHITTVSIEPEGVCVAVRDTGHGLGPESLSRLFEPFYTTKPDGMGMGLSICRSIIEAHGGRLWATRCEPRGALFQFTIPAD